MGEAIIDIKMFVVTLLILRPARLILRLGLSKLCVLMFIGVNLYSYLWAFVFVLCFAKKISNMDKIFLAGNRPY
jgi:hypothetical protein